jgi:hypothetical protein
MKRIQIAAQECNIGFLNPIVGTPEKGLHVRTYIFYYSFLLASFGGFDWNIKKPQSEKESLFFLPKLTVEFFAFYVASFFGPDKIQNEAAAIKTTSLQM